VQALPDLGASSRGAADAVELRSQPTCELRRTLATSTALFMTRSTRREVTDLAAYTVVPAALAAAALFGTLYSTTGYLILVAWLAAAVYTIWWPHGRAMILPVLYYFAVYVVARVIDPGCSGCTGEDDWGTIAAYGLLFVMLPMLIPLAVGLLVSGPVRRWRARR